MGKKSREKKKRRAISSLGQHKKVGKTLLPPMMQLPIPLTLNSWMNDRLAEMLWACLIISQLPRHEALSLFEKIARLGFNFRENEAENTKDKVKWGITHSLLSTLPESDFLEFVNILIRHPSGISALRPLLLIDSLPGMERWKGALNSESNSNDWDVLKSAVANTLSHNSQFSTDVRWLVVMSKMATGHISVMSNLRSQIEPIIDYPRLDENELQLARPTLRTMESAAQMMEKESEKWSEAFWLDCLKKTNCTYADLKISPSKRINYEAVQKNIYKIQSVLLEGWSATLSTTAVDACHDTVFGFGFYSLALLSELLSNSQNLTGRLVLRTLVECRICLAYLLLKNDADLWLKFRKFGMGQAKLALIKFNEMENPPRFINEDVLEYIASEDIYQEYVAIELGNWCGLDLRKMSEFSKTKEDYDMYYGVMSTYSHGHWLAIRNTSFNICLNPLHRVHRVPSLNPKLHEDVAFDAMNLVNKIILNITQFYPKISQNIKLDFEELVDAPVISGI